jgi:NhaC family Na+:H+ antiporter
MSDTTNLAPAMAGTDVFTHIGAMSLPTGVTYAICMVLYTVYGLHFAGGAVDHEAIDGINQALLDNFKINPILILPPLVVIGAAILKRGAMEGISLGILCGLALGWIFQGTAACGLGVFFDVGLYGYTIETNNEVVDTLLNRGGMMSMMESCGLAFMAMCFGGVMEKTKQMEVILNALTKRVKRPGGLVTMTEVTCFLSNCFMPDQYIAIIMPGRMFAEVNTDLGLHPKTLSNALESSATVTSSLIPWNSCGVYMAAALGIPTFTYLPFCWFNLMMPIVNIFMAYMGLTVFDSDGKRLTSKETRDKFKANLEARNARIAEEKRARDSQ